MSDEQRKVWALSSGSYSDYTVHALFINKKDAEEATKSPSIDLYGGYRVEEFMLFDGPAKKVTVYRMLEEISVSNPSFPNTAEIKSETKYPWEFWDGIPVRVKARQRGWMNSIKLDVMGIDKQAVQQTFSDRRAGILDKLVNP